MLAASVDAWERFANVIESAVEPERRRNQRIARQHWACNPRSAPRLGTPLSESALPFAGRSLVMATAAAGPATKQQCLAWLEEHGYSPPYDSQFTFRREFATPVDSGRKRALVKNILTWMPAIGEGLLFVKAWGIFPSSENPGLFRRVRDSIGEFQSLAEAREQILNLADRELLESFVDVCLGNYWDTLLASANRHFVIQFSHDEFVSIACNSEFEHSAQGTVDSFSPG